MITTKRIITNVLGRQRHWMISISSYSTLSTHNSVYEARRGKKNDSKSKLIPNIFKPVPVKPSADDINVGADITQALKKDDLRKVLATFNQSKDIISLAQEYGLRDELQKEALNSFRMYCVQAEVLPVDLHLVISDILQDAGHITDIFPYFIRHAKEIFPHIECLDELKQISDLRTPANWYPIARSKTRKIVFHAGPTNSGKTYHALERFRTAKSGLYCGPLKLLATEVFSKTNKLDTPCDLVTGEERQYGIDANTPANHLACTVEMARINVPCEVAVIDEIQLLKDYGRGWAWTRALLGIPADEIHLCGEVGAIDLVQALCTTTGEDVEVRRYKRLSELRVENHAVVTFKNIQPGDCIVCFNKNDIYTVSRELERLGVEVTVIYGSLPPKTKLLQASKFNDPEDPCKVMVATDAIGMGMNLHIRRIIFYSMIKPSVNEKGEMEMDVIPVSSALQIAGRAGRYGTQHDTGYVTTFKAEDLPLLQKILKEVPEPLSQAGLHPTAEQIELYAYHLPKATLSNLMDIFVNLCTVDDSLFFMCNIDDFKFLADMTQHVPLPLRARYVFCCAPINRKIPFTCAMFLKFARQYSKNEAITFNWMCNQIGWPLQPPKNILDLIHLEAVFDVLDLYLWLSYRFMDLFPDANTIRDIQRELDVVIQQGVIQITKLLKNSETKVSSGDTSISDEDKFQIKTQKQQYYRGSQKPISQSARSGKLTERLLSQGLLTAEMIQELQNEWMKQQKDADKNSVRKPTHRKLK